MNAHLRELYPASEELFDIVLVTYNHAHVGIRLINTINHHSESDKTSYSCLSIYGLWERGGNSLGNDKCAVVKGGNTKAPIH